MSRSSINSSAVDCAAAKLEKDEHVEKEREKYSCYYSSKFDYTMKPKCDFFYILTPNAMKITTAPVSATTATKVPHASILYLLPSR